MDNINDLTQKLVKNLTKIKSEYIRVTQELTVSIRKDVVAVELKDIINSSNNYNSLKTNLNTYINNLNTYTNNVYISKKVGVDNESTK